MKKFFTFSVLLVLSQVLFAQAPQGINYQGVARNAGGAPYNNQTVGVRLTLRSGTPTGTADYSEVRTVTTNAFGLFSLQIGSAGAESTTGNFAAINWNTGNKFLQTEIKLPGQASFTDLGTTQLMSVPYAINSLQARQLALPFDTSVNTNVYNKGAFKIRNTSFGQYEAISGESVNGNGIIGFSEKNDGVYGNSAAAAQAGVLGTNGTNGGYGVMGALANTNTDGIGVYGHANFATGVKGQSAMKTGVEGQSTNGAGVAGQSVNHHGVTGTTTAAARAGVHGMVGGSSANQIGVYGEAFNSATGVVARNANLNGLALDVQGKLKIAGNGQSPGAGKLLTSDANGNASWQHLPKIAFKLYGAYPHGANNYGLRTAYKVYFNTEEYDYGNNTSIGINANNSEFVAPITGLYHFDASVLLNQSGIRASITLIKIHAGGGQSVIAQNQYGEVQEYDKAGIGGRPNYQVSADVRLAQGDKVIVRIWWDNGNISDSDYTGVTSQSPLDNPKLTSFSGHLVFAD